VVDADHVRLGRIADKLAAASAMSIPPEAFGVKSHRFKLGAPLPEAVVAEFEERHEVALPPAYRLFVTELSDGGAGPGYRLLRLSASCDEDCQPGHLTRPSPYLPGPRYPGDWKQRYEEPPGRPGRVFLPGTLDIAYHGCTLYTQLVVTGPARGRLFNLDYGGSLGPYVVEDADFLAWYERWLDEVVAGFDTGWFGERLPLDEAGLIAALADDPSPQRRARAGDSLQELPSVSDSAWAALSRAMTSDVDAVVRAAAWDHLRCRWHREGRGGGDAEAIAQDIARYARSRVPVSLEALSFLDRLTVADVLPELAEDDLERRQRAAYRLAWDFGPAETVPPGGLLDDAVGRLLSDSDPILRLHGVAAVRRFDLAGLYQRLRELQQTETSPWVRYDLDRYLGEKPDPAYP
jgi:hypothetical protein